MEYVLVALVAMPVGALCYRLILAIHKERTSRVRPAGPKLTLPFSGKE